MRFLLLLAFVAALLNCNGNDKPVEKPAEVVESKMPDKGCVMESKTKMVSQRQVSQIQNLVEDKIARGYENQCTVQFDLVVDGIRYHLEETEIGLEQMASICYYAKERARATLLQDLGGEFKAESTLMCRQVDE